MKDYSPLLNLIIPAAIILTNAAISVWTRTPVFLNTKFPCLWALCWHGLLLHLVFILYLSKIFFPCLLNLFIFFLLISLHSGHFIISNQ